MWQSPHPPLNRRRNRQQRRGWDLRVWLALAVVVLLGIGAAQVFSSLSSSDPPAEVSTSGESDASSFLADGYAALDDQGNGVDSPSFWGIWLGMLLPLAIVIVGVYGLLRGLRYVNGRVSNVASRTKLLESLDTLSLGQHGTIHLVRIDQRLVVVGSGGQQVSLLTEIEPEQAQRILGEQRARAESGATTTGGGLSSFRELLQNRVSRPTLSWEPAGADRADIGSRLSTPEPSGLEVAIGNSPSARAFGRSTPASESTSSAPVSSDSIEPGRR